jgi:hypothetical protein
MSQERFKKYYAHLNDEKAHLVPENGFKKCEIVIKEEVEYFKEIEIRFLNKLLWDIDKFIFDQEYSEQSIQATFENIERIVSEHHSETFSGVLNWELFDKYLEVSDLQKKHHVYEGNYMPRSKKMRKKLFKAIDSINPELEGGVSALDFIKFKVMYQIISADYKMAEAVKYDIKQSYCNTKLHYKIKEWA